ncbi:MAG: DUF4276 family protein [Planctomycetaceae bacterium]|jgi:hypothetical protein|nr:DUF4276 family protein [Planctomycetaceae bacterium]
MHFEILVEDQSGKKALEILIPKIIGDEHTFNIHSYKGIGRIPKNLKGNPANISKRILLERLPKLLEGYGKTFFHLQNENYSAAVIVICDLDDKCLKAFRAELNVILDNCNPKPTTRFCIAIEEGEAWFLGDIPAIKAAYPKAKNNFLSKYQNDSICGTWECLADAVYKGGAVTLASKGWQAVGREKSLWAENICPKMNIENNNSPSFNYLIQKLKELL